MTLTYPLSPQLIENVLEKIAFNEQGLVPAIAQEATTKEVLMLAWMNKESIRTTLQEGMAVYWSRSRQGLWRKGDTSGHRQVLVDFRFDCDRDAVLLWVHQTGPACHTHRPNCFFYAPRQGNLSEGEIVCLTTPLSSET